MIRKEIQFILDSLPETELQKIYWSIKIIQKEYVYKEKLIEKGVIISDIFDGATEIINRWDKIFTLNISDDIKESIYYNQYRWHIFSYEVQDCLKAHEARNAFNTENKDELYVMYQNSPSVLLYSKAKAIVAEDFDSQQDIYIFDRNFTWTYINTHEDMCGPYFYKVK
ncbi:DUF4275 family protein [Paenibacillus sp. ISL-20]|uniref:DUF4275 family protein n=1 Tax=Paenibacillus sp. ISL-20 TaxID=2819163 RepID=UPI001BE71AA7|nr:DUF4275 family protein [Paenibacillus sp. ISL-20]MBT2762179.1 DUF4275 family protein [Paenibacillus sp. ISL-20]